MGYAINHNIADDIKARMGKRTADMEDDLATLARQSESMGDAWKGVTREAYRAAKQKWDAATLACKNVLATKINILGQVNETYFIGDQRSSKRFPA